MADGRWQMDGAYKGRKTLPSGAPPDGRSKEKLITSLASPTSSASSASPASPASPSPLPASGASGASGASPCLQFT